jgi:hypothetical protein
MLDHNLENRPTVDGILKGYNLYHNITEKKTDYQISRSEKTRDHQIRQVPVRYKEL